MLHLENVRTTTLLFAVIINNLFMCVPEIDFLPLRAVLKETGTAGLQGEEEHVCPRQMGTPALFVPSSCI